MTRITAPIIGINRHRILTDGKGVTTLVGFYGCPLRCKYCLNPHSISKDYIPTEMTVEQLIEEVKCDDIYFRATGGGICFTGGEPLLHTDFIKEFKEKCPASWKIYVETSLNVPIESLQSVSDFVDGYIVDIKDMNPKIYSLYTGKDNDLVIANLRYLSANNTGASVVIRIPSIPDYNHYKDLQNSYNILKSIGYNYNQFDRLTYITSREDHYKEPLSWPNLTSEEKMNPFILDSVSRSGVNEGEDIITSGKATCEVLKGIRLYISKYNEIPLEESKCTHKGQCQGTCSKCESELKSIASQKVSIPPSAGEPVLDKIIANLSKEAHQALKTHYVQPGNNWMTEGMCPRPEILRATRGPLQGDLDTHGIKMKPLSEEDRKLIHKYIIDEYYGGVELPPPPDDVQIII